MDGPLHKTKILMAIVFFFISMTGVSLPVLIPPSWMEGKVMPLLSSLSAGVMLGVALVSNIPI